MCWSPEASIAIAGMGVVTAALAFKRGEPIAICLTIAYFSLMEMLQAYTYSTLGPSCAAPSPSNQMATYLAYLHIAFQPFFMNALMMYFIPKEIRERIWVPVNLICFAACITLLIRIYPFAWAEVCRNGILCGDVLCSYRGHWHIAWSVPTTMLLHYTYPYQLAVFVLPLLYGSWRATLFSFLTGPALSYLLSPNPNEQIAIWCLLSVTLMAFTFNTPLRRAMRVTSWPLWPKSWLTTPVSTL